MSVVAAQEPAASLVFDGVTVVDVEQGRLVPGQQVVIVGNRIQVVTDHDARRVPKGAQVVEAQGKYLIPGFWDMHIHPMDYTEIVYPLLIAYGITGIREPGTPVPLAEVLQRRRDVAGGLRPGPRAVVTGAALDNRQNSCPLCGGLPATIRVGTPEEGRRAVDSLKAAGADFIKVHRITPRAVSLAIMDQAQRERIPLSGHLPDSMSLMEASDSGQLAFDHAGWHAVRRFCSPVDSGSLEQCARLAERLRRNGTWLIPYGRGGLSADDEQHICQRAPKLARIFAGLMPDSAGFLHALAQVKCELSETRRARKDSVRITAAHRTMERAGIPMLLGPDAAPLFLLSPLHAPALSLHWGLTSLVHDGFTPLAALQSVTLNPAKFLRATDSLGTVEPGKLADLVLLDADPLADIHNTQRISAVVANGRYYDRAALDALLTSIGAPLMRDTCWP